MLGKYEWFARKIKLIYNATPYRNIREKYAGINMV
jgi:hypothetical protein